MLFDQLLPYILFEKSICILSLEMASPGNQHCASCIGTLSFPIQSATGIITASFCVHRQCLGLLSSDKQHSLAVGRNAS